MNKELKVYLSNLKGKIYKILPLYESDGELVSKVYTDGVMLNLSSADRIFDGILIEILVKLNEIDFVKIEHKSIRKTVLECLNMVDKMLNEME